MDSPRVALVQKIADGRTDEETLEAVHRLKAHLKQNFRKKNHEIAKKCGINARFGLAIHPGVFVDAEYVDKGYKCYVCKQIFHKVHQFYHSMCTECGDFNLTKRTQTRDLTGMVAIVTGGRIKIGFQTCLKLLRAGADVVATTRFPNDALLRYKAESDYSKFSGRLIIYSLDLLDADAIDKFIARTSETFKKIDIIINNAAQTIDRPPEYYQKIMQGECVFTHDFPDLVDENGIQLDERAKNTWITRLSETDHSELLATALINYMAPFMLLRGLKHLMNGHTAESPCFVINVSSMEGKFTTRRGLKTDRHVHTDCAKAALNMITRSISYRWGQEHILVNSVETGWITDEFSKKKKDTYDHQFLPPLDEVDGAARILDPIMGYTPAERISGLFLKDYFRTAW